MVKKQAEDFIVIKIDKILVINSGIFSLKYQLFKMEDVCVLAKGVIHRIGIDGSYLEY